MPGTKFYQQIQEKLENGLRISNSEALELFSANDLLAVGKLAAYANRKINADTVYFNVNRHINYTNICVNRCSFCAFSKESELDQGAYSLAIDEIVNRAIEAHTEGASEIHMVGGLHPELPFDFYLETLAAIKVATPQLHIKAFTAVEIDYFSQLTQRSPREVLQALIDSGLDSMPGGGAEIFASKIRKKICPEKISGERWLEVTEQAHKMGLKTNATMLFGHIESFNDRIDHLAKLRDLQDRTDGFQAFIPLAFQPQNTSISQAKTAGGVDALKTLAISRIYLDNFRHLKAYWVMLGLKVAQVSLFFGVNDLDGTVIEEKIGHDAGADSPQQLDKQQLIELIRKAGKQPVERDTLYREIRAF